MKKAVALVLALVFALGLGACAPAAPGEQTQQPSQGGNQTPATQTPAENVTVNLKVWGSQDDQTMLGEMIESFKAQYTGVTFNIELATVGENDAKTRYLEDPAAGADVFAFANDQIKDLVTAGALYELSGKWKEAAISENGEGSVGSATIGESMYAFPMTADNGYFMYYDKSVFSADDVKSLDKMLEVAEAAGKKVFMDVSNGWYIASFFLGAGGKLGIDANGKQTSDFNNANGLGAAEAIKNFTAHSAFLTGDDAVFVGGMGTDIAAGVSGTWNATAIKDALGDNYAAAKLPTFTLNGNQMQMSSFAGYKLVGVSKLTNPDTVQYAMDLAAWLTNEDNQLKRFNDRAMGPSNVKASQDPAVLAAPELAALAEQGAYAVSQNDVLGTYWTPAEAFGEAMENKDYAKPLQQMLDEMVAQITA